MKIIKNISPYFLFVFIIILGAFALDYISDKLLLSQSYSTDSILKEETFPVYYINNSENFTLYPWDIYDDTTLQEVTDVNTEEIIEIINIFSNNNFNEDISISDFEYSLSEDILYLNKFNLKIAFKSGCLISFQTISDYQNDIEYTSDEIEIILESLNTDVNNLYNYQIKDDDNEQIDSNNSLSNLQIYFNKFSINPYIDENSRMNFDVENSNYELFVYKNQIYIIFKDGETTLTFVYDILNEEVVGFSLKY